ncbi:hypothetical protein Ancab_037136 [Ancistrocladus abbreviatus]
MMAARGGSSLPAGPLLTIHTNLYNHDNHIQAQPQNSNQGTQRNAKNRDTVIKPTPRRFRGSVTVKANSNTNPNTNTNGNGQSLREQGGRDITRRSRRKPGRPKGSKNKPKPPIIVTRDITPNTLTSHVIEVEDGCDIMEGVADFARRRQRGVCVLSGNGCVSNVTIRHMAAPNASIEVSTFQGRFGILSLTGTFLPPPFQPPASSLTLYLAGGEGQVMGGCVVGPLLASGPVVIMAASFGNVCEQRVPLGRRAGECVGDVGLPAPILGGSGSGSGSGSDSGNDMASSWPGIDGQPQPGGQPEWQLQPQHQRPHEQLEQEGDQLQLLGDPINNANPANSNDLLDGFPSNILSSCQLSPPHHDEAYWAGAITGPFV